jgi:hypothetical protein
MIYKFFLLFLIVHTPFNPSGVLPIYLLFAVLNIITCLFQAKKYVADYYLFINCLIIASFSVFTTFVNSDEINQNHLMALLFVLFAYFYGSVLALQKIDIFNVTKVLNTAFKLYILISIIDYTFNYFIIPLHEIIPMELRNKSVIVGYFYRIPGFYEEPTNWAGLGIGLGFHYFLSTNDGIVLRFCYLILLILILALTRSAAAIGITFVVFSAYILMDIISKKSVISTLKILPLFLIPVLLLQHLDFFKLEAVIRKISLDSSVASVSGRLSGWGAAYSEWSNGSTFQILFGQGVGYAELNLGSVHSWFLTLLLEQGFVGLILITLLIGVCIINGIKNFVITKPVLFALATQLMMLTTNTQFYHPLFWVLLAICSQGGKFANTRYK